ncbi:MULTISPECIES: hypothetical protein [Yersinia pseudotuberculosis complex]|uniref:hypothetical protein n=1 Tax=Yersinia pseudotuberculosis complex TaxID=1649845 RepID=UPI0011AB108D|nr:MULTISPECIES: hypothetical protein [Yersinia pseudotuberculosis complex]MBK1425909.1 hypothetical protein [Yersinia pseudotuberculosis]
MSIKQPIKVMTLTVEIFMSDAGAKSEIKCQGKQAASDFINAYVDEFSKFHPQAMDKVIDMVTDKNVTEIDIRPNQVQAIVH